MAMHAGGRRCDTGYGRLTHVEGDVLYITGLERATSGGAWSSNLTLDLM